MAVSEIWTKNTFFTCVITMLFLSSSRMREMAQSTEAIAEQA